MKRCFIVIPLIAGVMFFSGCLGLNSGLASGGWIGPGGWSSGGSGGSGESGGSSESLGIDPATQAGIDADNAATDAQSAQDVRDAAAQAIAASANQ
jgi:hypothetical protein